MDSSEGAAVGEDVFDGGGEGSEFGAIADDAYFRSDGTGEVEGAGEEGASVELEKGFVGAHARAFAAGEDEGGEIGGHGRMIHGALRRSRQRASDATPLRKNGFDWRSFRGRIYDYVA